MPQLTYNMKFLLLVYFVIFSNSCSRDIEKINSTFNIKSENKVFELHSIHKTSVIKFEDSIQVFCRLSQEQSNNLNLFFNENLDKNNEFEIILKNKSLGLFTIGGSQFNDVLAFTLTGDDRSMHLLVLKKISLEYNEVAESKSNNGGIIDSIEDLYQN